MPSSTTPLRELGATEVSVPRVVLGAWAIGGWQWGGTRDDDAVSALRAAPEHGMCAIDTAPIYGFGHSEELVGRAIAGRRDEFVVCTKLGLRWDSEDGQHVADVVDQDGKPRRIFQNSRPESVHFEVDRSLERLGVDVIDLLQVHWRDFSTPVADTMGALAEVVRAGKARAVGVSNYSVEDLTEAARALGDVPLASDQPRYSLIWREAEEGVLPWCRANDVGTIVYSPLGQGLLTGKVGPERAFPPDDIRSTRSEFSKANRARIAAALGASVLPIAEAHGATPAQVVLAWTAAQPGITAAIAGVRNLEQLEENAGALTLELADGELATIRTTFERLELDVPKQG